MAFKHSFPSEISLENRIAKLEDRLDLYNKELSNARLQVLELHRLILNLNLRIDTKESSNEKTYAI